MTPLTVVELEDSFALGAVFLASLLGVEGLEVDWRFAFVTVYHKILLVALLIGALSSWP